ncbi:MAG: efflux RND transporter periplasmic adaptor subunit, partial [Actinomycetota bacterium]
AGGGSGSGGSGGAGGAGSGRGQASPEPSPSASGSGKSGSGTGGAGTGGAGTGSSKSSSASTTGRDGSGSPSTSSTPTNSAEQLATDQASIDSAEASLVEAQQSMDDAQLSSPITGTVASVNLTAGQSVSAGSTSDTIVVVNSGSFQATSSLTSNQVAEVNVGDTAQVTVDGASGTLAGTVSRVGPVNASSSSITYPMVVALSSTTPGAANGATARVSVDVAQATDALVVPTSAVHTTAVNRAYVLELSGGQETEKVVGVGVVGSVYTQITSGITKGTTVVLADYSQSVPSSSSNTTRTFGGAGGLTGGTFRVGGGGGGFTGGAGGGLGGAGGLGGGTGGAGLRQVTTG